MKERRSEKRIECSFPLEFLIQNKPLKVIATNISNSGICFKAEEEIPLFRELAIELRLPGKSDNADLIPIKCTGIVVRCDERDGTFDTALFFMDISVADQNRLEKYTQEAV